MTDVATNADAKVEATPIGDILAQGQAESQQPSASDAAVEKRDHAPESPSQPEQPGWVGHALHAERKKRQAYQTRVKELEEENELLLMAQRQSEEFQQSATRDPAAEFQVALNLRASRAEFVAEHGRETFQEMDAALGRAMAANHPEIPALREAMLASPDPTAVAMEWWKANGGGPRQQSAHAGTVFPSGLANVRNVGKRSGPLWSGPTPLGDILGKTIFK